MTAEKKWEYMRAFLEEAIKAGKDGISTAIMKNNQLAYQVMTGGTDLAQGALDLMDAVDAGKLDE